MHGAQGFLSFVCVIVLAWFLLPLILLQKGELFSTPQIFPNYGKLSENAFFQTSDPKEYIGWDPHI